LDTMTDLKNLLKEIKAYRNDMVARGYPFQEISNIITKWENFRLVGNLIHFFQKNQLTVQCQMSK